MTGSLIENDKRCSECLARGMCMARALIEPQLSEWSGALTRITVPQGQAIIKEGAPLDKIYIVQMGCFLSHTSEYQKNSAVNIKNAGDLLGVGGIEKRRYPYTSVAAADCNVVCAIPYQKFLELLAGRPRLIDCFASVMSRELNKQTERVLMMKNTNAMQKLALFLVSTSDNLTARSMSGTDIKLLMSRADIGDFLGITIETVSRVFSQFEQFNILKITGKNLTILDLDGLRRVASGTFPVN